MWSGCWGQRLFVVRQVAASDAGLLGATRSCVHSSSPTIWKLPANDLRQPKPLNLTFPLHSCHLRQRPLVSSGACPGISQSAMWLKAFLERSNNEKQWTIWCTNNFHIFLAIICNTVLLSFSNFVVWRTLEEKMKNKKKKRKKERKKAWRSKKEGRQRNRKKMEWSLHSCVIKQDENKEDKMDDKNVQRRR